MIPEVFLESVRQRVLLSRLIGQRVRLVRKGRNFSGLCPFHQEKTPSFVVDDGRSQYTCYGCGARGDIFEYLKVTQGISFYEAVQEAAGMAGLTVPASPSAPASDAGGGRSLDDLYGLLDRACTYFQQQLLGHEAAQEYLRRRGVLEEDRNRFRLGYAPDGGLETAMRQFGYDGAQLESAGLLGQSTYGQGSFQRFRGRLMFPIFDLRGRTVGFGGRTLGDESPKYLNSPETPLFHKGRMLYWGLPGPSNRQNPRSLAGRTLDPSGPLVVVEGYMDVLAVSRIAPAAAPLGTAVTTEQLQVLWRMADTPIFCFDGDGAGQRACVRVAKLALPALMPGKSLSFVQLPQGKDPAELILGGSPQHKDWFSGQLDKPTALVDWLWDSVFAPTTLPNSTPEQRAQAVFNWKELVQTITHPDVRGFYAEVLGERLAAQRAKRLGKARGDDRSRFFPTQGPGRRAKSSQAFGYQSHSAPVGLALSPVAVDLPLRLLVGALILDSDLRASVRDQAAQIQGPKDHIWLQILADVLSYSQGDCASLLNAYFGAEAHIHLETIARHLPSCPAERSAYWTELFNAYHTQLYQRQEIAALQEEALEENPAWQRLKTLTQL
jgi:DNA primase